MKNKELRSPKTSVSENQNDSKWIEEERNAKLEEHHNHNLRCQQTVAQNPEQTYKEVVNYTSVNYKSLDPSTLYIFLHFLAWTVGSKSDFQKKISMTC